jgi:hypothetical protein
MEGQPQTQNNVQKREHHGGGIFWPIILISAGVVFLLNNLGLMRWDVWALILRLWPVILIAIGLDIIVGRKSVVASLLVAVVTIAVIGGGVWYLTTQTTSPSSGAIVTKNITQGLEGAESAEIKIGMGVGTLRLGTLAESDLLLQGSIQIGENEGLTQDAHKSGDMLYYTLKTRGDVSFPFFHIDGWDNERLWDLKINRSIPTHLVVDTGVSDTTLNLENVNLTSLDVNGGVGKATITLPAKGRFQVSVDAGVGSVIVRIPEGLAARIRVDSGLGAVDTPGDYRQNDKVYTSPNYDTANNRVDIDINGGIGKITVEEYRGE